MGVSSFITKIQIYIHINVVLLTFENQSVVDFNIVRFEILDRVKGRGGDS